MEFNLRISLKAETDAIKAIDYYDNINKVLADRFSDELYDVYNKLKNNPQFYSLISSNPQDPFR
jgi:hypothetical protein